MTVHEGNYPAILLIGKTGAGKSTLGNLLLGRNEFAISDSCDSLTQECKIVPIEIDGKMFCIVDTPGIVDTGKTNEEILRQTTQAISQCNHGIQAIVFVMEATRFTQEQEFIIDQMIHFLGQDSLNHIIAVFSKCKKAPTMDPSQLFNSLASKQKDFLNRIDNRFTVSPNLDIFDEPNDPTVARNMTDLRNYIVDIPNLYTIDDFEKCIAQVREIQEIEKKRTLSVPSVRSIEEVDPRVILQGECFATDSGVILRNGKVTKISELTVGDYVCCGFENRKRVFSEVFLIIHANPSAMTEFQLIDFVKPDGIKGTLYITPGHHIFVNDGKTDFAKNVLPNKSQLFVSDGEKLVSVTPTRITRERKEGYYCFLTRSGTVLVDDVLCSCYASVPPYQTLFNFAFVPLRIYTKVFPSNYLDKEIHPYVKFLNRGRWIVELLDYLNVQYLK